VRFSEPGLASFLSRHDVDLDRSSVWLSGREHVAVALLAIRERHAWVGAFGVAAGFRGRGLSHGFFSEVVAQAREAGATHVELEVLEQKLAARAVYARAGFEKIRELRSFERAGRATGDRSSADEFSPELANRVTEPPGTTWQNRFATIVQIEGLLACVAGDPERPDAFAFFGRREDEAMVYLANGEPHALEVLIEGILQGSERVVAHNVPRGSACEMALEAADFTAVHTQFALARPLEQRPVEGSEVQPHAETFGTLRS
jgi:GNAT superfamily N-acetyltransferase